MNKISTYKAMSATSMSPSPAANQSPVKPTQRKLSDWRIKILLGVLGLGALATGLIEFWPGTVPSSGLKKHVAKEAEAASISLTATNHDPTGVTANTAFRLTAKEGKLTAAVVKEKLKIVPAVAFTVAEENANTFVVTPAEPLAAKTVYTAAYDGQAVTAAGQRELRQYSWAFQVRQEFGVLGTYPRDQATGVPAATGLEITFTAPGVTAADFAEHLTVKPKITGRVEIHQRTLVFVPGEPLKDKTLYTVTLKAGLRPAGGATALTADYVWRFETAVKPGDESFGGQLVPENFFETVRPDEPLVFSSLAATRYDSRTKKQGAATYDFTIYRFRSLDDFQSEIEAAMSAAAPWAYYARSGYVYETKQLQKVATVKTKSEDGVLTLPKGFDPGAYLAESNSYGIRSQLPFLVTDLGGYALTTKTDTLVWVNNLKQGKPVAGATISGPNRLTASTDNQGIARFTTPTDLISGQLSTALLTIAIGTDKTFFVANGQSSNRGFGFYGYYGSSRAADDYWAYLGTDRSIYQPDDLVHFWGVARPRHGGPVGGGLKIELVNISYDTRYAEQVVAEIPISLTVDGTFIGQIAVRDLPVGGSKVLRLSAGDQLIVSRYLDVQTYRRPAYQLSVTPNRYALISGEQVTYTVTAKFFDGTPVLGAVIRLTAGGDYNLTTDRDGTAMQVVTVTEHSGNYAYVSPADDATSNITATTYVQVYPAEIEISASGSVKDNTAVVNGTVRNLYPRRADPSLPDPLAPVIGEPRPDQEVSGRLVAILYDKIPTGQYYDFLAKQVVPTFRYQSREEERSTFTVVTDHQGKFSRSLDIDPDTSYKVVLSANDAAGRTTDTTVYLYWRDYGDSTTYSAVNPDVNQSNYNPRYKLDDRPSLVVKDGGGTPVADGTFTFLFLTAQRGLRDYELSTSSTYRFTFDQDDIPNIQTRVVMFSGRGYRELYGPLFQFDSAARKLNITLTPDQSSYGVRQKINLAVQVTNQSGQGVKARVNVKAIDQAVATLESPWQQQDILNELYRYVDDGVFGSYLSHQEFARFFGAEGGGGGDGRRDFRDAAAFMEIVTDEQGRGQASFDTPDNLTSWRVGAQAVSQDNQAGQTTILVPVTQPLFVVPTLESRILSADRPHLRAVAHGSALKTNDPVEYEFSVIDQIESAQKKIGRAFESAVFELPALEPGDYQVKTSVKAKGQSDAVILPVHVTASNLRQKAMSVVLLESGGQPVLASTGRTDLMLGDADRMLGHQVLWTLLDNPYSRLDDAVAATMTEELLTDYFDQRLNSPDFDPYQYLIEGGLALYPLGSADVEYAALAAGALALEPVRGQLINWFQSVVDNPKTNTAQAAYALYGLAQLRQPVLDQINQLLALADLPDHEKLTLALALEAVGASEEARPIAGYLLERYGQEETPYMILGLGATGEDRNVATARFGILAAGLNLDSRYGLLRFALAHPPVDTTTHLEQALAVSRLLAQASTGKVSVTYAMGDKTETKDLAGAETLELSLDAAEAKTFQVTGHSGNVAVVSTYSQAFDPAKAKSDPNLSISRRYLVGGRATTTFKRGDLVRVEFSWSKKAGAIGTRYGLVDYLPTGLRPLSNPWSYTQGYDPDQSYPYAIEHNRVKLYLSSKKKTFYYLAQAVIGGTALAEPPVLQAFDAPGSIQFGQQSTNITVGD